MLSPVASSEPIEEQYTYYAFISYKHDDEKWAKWIQNKLETYKLPSVLQKESRDIPNRITPIFRDKTDITSGPLKKTLSKELQASKFLIVICSPRAAKSIYVNYEVEQFIGMGRQDRIIPLIIDGEVGAQDAEKECYVSALHSTEEIIIGIDLPKLGKRKTFLNVIATMLEIKLDALVRRDRIRQRRKNFLLAIAVALTLVIGIFAWDYYVPKKNYYSDYVLQWGLPKGIFELKKGFFLIGKNEIKGKDDFYIITESKSAKTITLKHVNSLEVLIDYHTDTELNDRPVMSEYEYKVMDGTKHVSTAKYMDRYNNVLMVLKYSDDSTIVDFTSGDGSNSPITLSGNLFAESGMLDALNVEVKSAITRYVYGYDDNGYIISAKFMRDNRATSPTPDQNGITGYRCEVDNFGRIVSKQMIYNFDNVLGNVAFDRMVYDYDDTAARLLTVTYLDIEGNLVLNYDGYAKKEFDYYENGNLMDIYYYDNNLEPCFCTLGYSYVSVKYDKSGFHQEQSYYDGSGNLLLCDFGYAREVMKYDEEGNQIEMRVYDVDGSPIVALPEDTSRYISGFAIMRMQFNTKNMLIKQSYYDENDKPMLCNGGYQALAVSYDAKGRVEEVSYYGISGEPVQCNDGFEKFIKVYNEFGLVTEWRYCNADGSLAETEWGYSRMACEFDSNRNARMLSYYDASDHLVIMKDNLARQEMDWNDRGFLTAIRNYDSRGELIVSTLGYAIMVKEYNDSGYCIKDIYYDQNEKPVINKDLGYAKYVASYDEQGNCTEMTYYGSDDKLIINDTLGYAEYKSRYNNSGKKLEETYFDQEGNLIIPDSMYWARHSVAYNNEGLAVSESYYDTSNKLVLDLTAGYAKLFLEYDEWNNISNVTFYGPDNTVGVSPLYGYAVNKNTYENNYLVRESYYDESGNLLICPAKNYAELIQKWDENGYLLERSTYAGTGKPILNFYNYSSVKYKYNEFGYETEREYYGLKGRPTIAYDCGYSMEVNRYDEKGEWVSWGRYDVNGELVSEGNMVSQPIVYVKGVTALSNAAKIGVQLNDIILKIGNWCYFPLSELDVTFAPLSDEVARVQDEFKEVVIYRPSDASIRIFGFGAGVMGIQLTDTTYKFPNQEVYGKFITKLEELYMKKYDEK